MEMFVFWVRVGIGFLVFYFNFLIVLIFDVKNLVLCLFLRLVVFC